MRHTCVSKLTIIASGNGLSPGRHQAIFWTNVEYCQLALGNKLQWNFIRIHTFSIKKMSLKMSSAKWRLSRRGPNVLSEHRPVFMLFCGLLHVWGNVKICIPDKMRCLLRVQCHRERLVNQLMRKHTSFESEPTNIKHCYNYLSKS